MEDDLKSYLQMHFQAINEKMDSLNTNVALKLETFKLQQKHLESKVDQHLQEDRLIFHGPDGRSGLLSEMDTAKAHARTAVWVATCLAAPILTAAVLYGLIRLF